MFIDRQVYIDSPVFPEAEWEGNGELLVWTNWSDNGVRRRILVFGVSLHEFLELQRTANHESIVRLIMSHRRQWV